MHIDIDASEINKNKPAHLPIISDIKYALGRLVEMIKERPIQKKFTAWHEQIDAWKAKAPFGYRVTEEVMQSQHMRDHLKGGENEVILPQMAIEMLYELTQGRRHYHHRRGPAPDVERASSTNSSTRASSSPAAGWARWDLAIPALWARKWPSRTAR